MLKKSCYFIFAILLLSACNPDTVVPEDACNFVQNSQGQRVSWNLNNRLIPIYFHQNVPQEAYESAFASMKIWENRLQRKLFEFKGVISQPSFPDRDGYSVIYFLDNWEEDRHNEQARTTIYWIGSEIKESDLRFNIRDFSFSYSLTHSEPDKVDLRSLLLHELGHVLGLAHNDELGSVMATMLSSNFLRVDPSQHDISSLRCEY